MLSITCTKPPTAGFVPLSDPFLPPSLSLSRNCLNLCDSDFESSKFLCDCDLGKLKSVMFWAAEARRERHVGRGHGEKGQEARGAGVCSYPEVDCLSGTHLFQFWVPSWDRFF